MNRFLESRLFVALTPLFHFALFLVAGVLLGYVPYVSGATTGASGYTHGETVTEYVFRINHAAGIWLIGAAVSLLVLLVCLLIRKISLRSAENN